MSYGVDPRYIPPEIPGYVTWSNFTRDSVTKQIIPMTELGRMFVVHITAQQFNIPEADVCVQQFTPTDGYNSPIWTAYVKECHRELVDNFNLHVIEMIRELKMMLEKEVMNNGYLPWRSQRRRLL